MGGRRAVGSAAGTVGGQAAGGQRVGWGRETRRGASSDRGRDDVDGSGIYYFVIRKQIYTGNDINSTCRVKSHGKPAQQGHAGALYASDDNGVSCGAPTGAARSGRRRGHQGGRR